MFLRKIKKINIRSLFLNFYLLPFKQAIHFPLLFASSVKIERLYRGGIIVSSKILKSAMIQIGYSDAGTIISKSNHSVLEIHTGGKIIFEGNAHFGAGCIFSVGEKGELFLGENVTCTGKTTFIVHKKVNIEHDCLISWDCIFMDTDFHKIIKDGKVINPDAEITIKKNSWIGCKCTLLKGSVLPADSVLGAGSLVNTAFLEEGSVYVGNPVRIVKNNIEWRK